MRPLAEQKSLALHVETPSDASYALLDQGALVRIFDNLIGNAIKFTNTGEVHVSVRTTDDRVEISVHDTGVGIDVASQERLFNAFYQESAGLSRSFEGVGLGLAIVKQLVELQDGSIRVESRKGAGSTFTTSFPRTEAPEPLGTGHRAQRWPPSSSWAQILVVEDNDSMRFLLKQILGEVSEVYRIEVAADDEEALRLAHQHRFDALVLDINLRRAKSGIDVLQELRQLPEYARAPAIAMTAYALPGDRERFLAAGFDAYLGKPFNPESLQEMLVYLLYQAQQENVKRL